jgi:hypothetical protein
MSGGDDWSSESKDDIAVGEGFRKVIMLGLKRDRFVLSPVYINNVKKRHLSTSLPERL